MERASLTPFNLGFINFSLTPVECSVVCSRQLAERFFMPLANKFNKLASSNQKVWFSDDDFIAMQVEGQGLDAGRRVLELTGPLALAGMYVVCFTTDDPPQTNDLDLFSLFPPTSLTTSWSLLDQKIKSSALCRVKGSRSRPTPTNLSTTSTYNLLAYNHQYTSHRHLHPRRPL